MIINTHNKTCYQQQRLESTNSNREQQTSRLATLYVLIFNDGRRIHNIIPPSFRLSSQQSELVHLEFLKSF